MKITSDICLACANPGREREMTHAERIAEAEESPAIERYTADAGLRRWVAQVSIAIEDQLGIGVLDLDMHPPINLRAGYEGGTSPHAFAEDIIWKLEEGYGLT